MAVSEADILRCAKVLIDQHGPEAKEAAIERAIGYFRKGDLDGHAVWNRIAKAAEWLWGGLPANDNQRPTGPSKVRPDTSR